MPKDDRDAKQRTLILARFDYSRQWRRAWDDKWLRWYKLFRGVIDALPEAEKDRSNLHIPYTYSTIDTIRSKLINAVFAQRPWISFIPKDPDDRDNARNMETLVDFQLGRTDAESIVKFYALVTDMLIYGGCPYECGWRRETRMVKRRVPVQQLDVFLGYNTVEMEVPVWDDPDFQPFMIDDLYPDPDSTTIDDGIFVIRRQFITPAELKQQVKQGIYKVKDWDAIKRGYDEISEGRQDRLAAIGASASKLVNETADTRRYELLHMWEDDHVSTLCNRAEVVRDGDNPFWHGKKPLGFAKIDPLNGEFYGISAVELAESLQNELNTTRNQRIDANNIAIFPMWKVLKGCGLEAEDLRTRPSGIVWLDQLEGALEEVKFTPPSPQAFTEETIIKSDIQEVTGTYSEVRGAPSTDQRTATENAIRDKAQAIRFDAKVKLFESLGLKRLGFFYDQLNQQFIDDTKQIRTRSDDGGWQWSEVSPESIAGNYEYQPAGTSIEPSLDKLTYKQDMMLLYDKMRQDPTIKQYELKKRVLQAYGIKDPEKLLMSEEESMAQAAQAAQTVQPGGEILGENVQGQVAQAGGGGPV